MFTKYPGLLLLVLMVVSVTACAQNNVPEQEYPISLIRNLAQRPANAGAGFTEKQLNRLGDKISITIIKGFDSKDLLDAKIVKNLLPLISQSFAQPQLIVGVEDRKPQVTLFLLRYLKENIADIEVKNEIVTMSSKFEKEMAIAE